MAPTAKKQKTSSTAAESKSRMWCKSCWKWAKKNCTDSEDHQCVAASEARKFAEEEFKEVREEFKLKEQRFLSVAQACDRQTSAVLEGEVDCEASSDWGGWIVNGGKFRIHLAASSVTEDEKESLVEELEGTDLQCSAEMEECASFSIEMNPHTKSFFKKLPMRVEGVTLPEGTILLEKRGKEYYAMVFADEIKPHVYQDTPLKIFGRIDQDPIEDNTNPIHAFCISLCDGYACGKFCEHEKEGSSSMSGVRFL